MTKTDKGYNAAIAPALRDRIDALQNHIRAIELIIDGHRQDPDKHSITASFERIKKHCREAIK